MPFPLDGQTTQLTQENKQIYDQIEMGKVEGRWMKTTDGKEMLTWSSIRPSSIRIRISDTALLRRRSTEPGKPILELSLEHADYGCQRLYRCSTEPPRTSRFRSGMERSYQRRLRWAMHEGLFHGNRRNGKRTFR